MTKSTNTNRTGHRGFASMDEERQREIASMGGKAVEGSKRSFSQSRALAVEAGRKGGMSVPDHKRSFFTNRKLASEAGRKGGQSVPSAARSFSVDPKLAAKAGRKGGLTTASNDQKEGKPDEATGIKPQV